MKNNELSRLMRLAKTYLNEIEPKLFKTKSKPGLKNYIYRIADKLTKNRRFRDDYWNGATNVFKAIAEAGFDIDWWAENGGYAPDGLSKTYKFKIEFTNAFGTRFSFKGQLICSFCGTVEDPSSVYDVIFQIF